MLTGDAQYVGKDGGIDQRAYAVMDDHQVVRLGDTFQAIDSVADGFLAGLASGDDCDQLVDVELLGVGAGDLFPTFDTDHDDFIDFGVPLEAFQSIDDDGLIEDIDELLGQVLAHARA